MATYTFNVKDLSVTGTEYDLVYLAELLREVDASTKFKNLAEQIEHDFYVAPTSCINMEE